MTDAADLSQGCETGRLPYLRNGRCSHGRPHIGAYWVSSPPGKMDEKLKSENMQKEQFSMFIFYFESNQGRQM